MSNKEEDQDKLLSSNYDGIQEFDNDLPGWWVKLFYLTVIGGIAYAVYFHIYPGVHPVADLAQEMASLQQQRAAKEAVAPQESSEEQLLALTKDAAVVHEGQEVFNARCVACHGPNGQGLIGPNLTDKYWIHGAKLVDTRRVIVAGVLDKGMLAWKGVLTDSDIDAVVAYLGTIRGTNPPNPKAPQGDPVE